MMNANTTLINFDYVNDIMKNCQIKDDLCIDNFASQVIDYLPKNLDYSIDYGATKGVIILNSLNYVIKIPFRGEMNDNKFFPYCGANCDNMKECAWDYCNKEFRNWKRIQEYQLTDIFLPIRYAGSVCGHPYYLQQKVATLGKRIKPIEVPKIESICKELQLPYFSPNWLNSVYVSYGEEYFIRFLRFLQNEIDDFNSGNLGYFKGRPVIIDYAGFFY